jgi:hypothetical protein
MAEVQIDLARIDDWNSFHELFAEVLGFPEFYGRNMNAWIDCMSDISSDAVVGMTRLQVPESEDLVLALSGSGDFADRCPQQYLALLRSTAAVNLRKAKIPESRRLLLLLS